MRDAYKGPVGVEKPKSLPPPPPRREGMEVQICESWDALPPIVFDAIGPISLRLLEHRYRRMETALQIISTWASCDDMDQRPRAEAMADVLRKANEGLGRQSM